MNLYRIYQTTNRDWDTYDSAVVAADSEAEARNMDPKNGEPLSEDSKYCWEVNPELVAVELIGLAKEGTSKGVICASYNAG